MYNIRPLDDQRTEEARQRIAAIYREYDLAGAFMIINPNEAGFLYSLPTTWSAFQDDHAGPLGIRIKAKSSEIGHDRSHALLEGAAHTLCQLVDFGLQTTKWCSDLLSLMRRQGLEIEHTPWNGAELPTIEEWQP